MSDMHKLRLDLIETVIAKTLENKMAWTLDADSNIQCRLNGYTFELSRELQGWSNIIALRMFSESETKDISLLESFQIKDDELHYSSLNKIITNIENADTIKNVSDAISALKGL